MVLPDPLGPRKVTNSPRTTSIDTSSTALDLAVVRFHDVAQAQIAAHVPAFDLVDDERVDDDAAALPGKHLDRVEVDLGNAVGMIAGKVGERVEAGGEAFDVGGLAPADRAEQRRAARLGDHRLGVAVAQRQHA